MNTLQKSIVSTTIAVFILTSAAAVPVYAQTPTTATAVTPGARQAGAINRLKTRADAEITRRVTALNLLATKIGAMKRLTSAQQSTFATGIQVQISSLNDLKTKIDADTDLATLRTDVQSIVKSYRIFALYLPQVNIMSNADRVLAIIDEMNAISTKLQARIDIVKTAGKDTAQMQSLMTDRAAKLTDASTQATNAINTVLPLTPDGYPANKTTLQSARTMLQTARTDLRNAESDATQVRQLLRASGVKTVTPTP